MFSPVLRWTGCSANFGICFHPRQLSLQKIQAFLPFFLLSGLGVFALLPLRTSVLCMFAAKHEAVEVVVFHSDNLHLHLLFLNKNWSFFKQKSLWMCAALSISSWRIIFLSTRIHLCSAAVLELPTELLLWPEQTTWLVVFTFFCCFSPYSLHESCITQIACFLQSS